MHRTFRIRTAVAVAALLTSCLSNTPSAERQTDARQADAPPQRTGQSITALGDGRLLVLGGLDRGRAVADAYLVDPRTHRVTRLPAGMLRARSGHTATVLPNGQVLIVGGSDAVPGHAPAEIFDVDRLAFSTTDIGITHRSQHTATLLTDGRVLFAGGRGVSGEPLDTAVLWNPADGSSAVLALQGARAGHDAVLQTDGTVLITGGADAAGELFVPGADVIVAAAAPSDVNVAAYLAGSSPADGATAVSVNARIALRFSRELDPHSVRADTVRLSGAGDGVSATFSVAEHGRLVFVQPTAPLTAGTTYVLVARGLASRSGDAVPLASLSFTTATPDESVVTPPADDVWRPEAPGKWRTGAARSPWQDLPPLMALDGVTALSGQVLRLNGTPLADVEVQIGGQIVRSDRSGRFLLRLDGLATGRHVLAIEGATANRPGRQYGFFEAGVQVLAGRTTVLPHTIWMPALDTAHSVTIPSPTPHMVVSTPLIPGLELHLPAGAVIRDRHGNRVTQISITPIPVDRPPFPLPAGVEVPIYFTIQPGGARVAVYGSYARGARLYYPNYTSQPPGTRMDFWHYDPQDRGWFVYGQGAVEPSGREVIPDRGVSIYKFTGAMISTGGTPPGWGPTPGGPDDGDPVDLATGLFVMRKMDLFLRDVLPLTLTRTYRQADSTSRPFGIGSTLEYDLRLWRPSLSNYDGVALILPDGARINYDRIDGGTGFVDMVLEHTSSPTAFYKSRITWNGNGFDLKLKDGTVLVFGDNAPLQSIRDRFGNTITLVRPTGQSGPIARILSPNGRWIALTYDTAQRITQATDNIGRTVTYTYDGSGRLWKVTDAAGGVTEYTYDSSHRMLTIKDPRGITYLTNTYDSNGRIDTQTLADGGVFDFAYTLDASGNVTQTDVTNPRGYVRRVTFNAQGYHLTDTEAHGTSLAGTTTLTRQMSSQLVTSVTDPLSRQTDFTYNANGRLTSIVRLAGTTNAVTTTFTYEPAYQQLASVTDPLNHTSTFTYDYEGRLTAVTDPLNHQSTFTYNAAGQPLTVTNALSKTITFGYSGGDLISVTSPLGHVTTVFTDGAGRTIRTTDPGGRSTRTEYGPLDVVTKVIDGLAGETSFTYDGNGNLLTLTDARGKTTTWTYNNMDRVATRTDPLTRQESFTYDLNGNVKTWTDRKGQVTSYTYDALDRNTFVGFGTTGTPPTYASSVTTTFDAGDRATTIVDSGAGTISRAFDLLDRMTQEVTPDGTIDYTYDAASRRSTMQVAGQSSVSYTYDNADRLTGIAQGTATMSLAYDNADRRTSLTLPNGIVVEYGYDDDSQLAGLTYKLSGTTLGSLTYEYDGAGQRTSVGGTWARSNLPLALSSASYDDANQIATWAGTSFTYDSNGNLTSDGSRSYMWNARNELTAISGAVSAAFGYDGVGRRRSRTVGTASKEYLYDGLNPVQELAAGTAVANLLTGLAIDEYFTRTDASGVASFLTDALQSNVALANNSGAIQTEYTYEPFGTVTTSGSTTGNTFTFTGREADGTGLYYFRARYYDPRLQRFLSSDPIGLQGGDTNLFTYAHNSPSAFTDPLGLTAGRACAPPEGPECFVQLKYRDVRNLPGDSTHSFWYVQDRTGKQYILSATKVGSFLNKVKTDAANTSAVDNVTATTHWQRQGDICDNVDRMLQWFNDYPNNKVPYNFWEQNSNAFSRYLGAAGGFTRSTGVSSPPNATGWDSVIRW